MVPLISNIMIYPTSSKKEFTLNFPYSELFRKFTDRLQQPEAVSFVVGYSFYDEHIMIYQALASPSFTIIIVDFKVTNNEEKKLRLNNLKDPRIIISQEKYLGGFKIFVKELLPSMEQEDTRAKVTKTFNREIGRVVAVDSFRLIVELSDEIKGTHKSSHYEVTKANLYIIIPVKKMILKNFQEK